MTYMPAKEVKFHLKIMTREGKLYEGDVSSITSYNDKGKFDVLAHHANFISLVRNGVEVRESETREAKDFKFDNALIRVKDDNVGVYVGLEGMRNLPKVA